MADISFNIARKELKIAQIAQLYQLFRLLHLIYIYSHGFYELSRMLMREKVNNDVSKDSPIQSNLAFSNSVNSKPRYFEGRSNALGFTLPLHASPVISKPCYFELFFHFPWDFEIAGFDCICTSTLRVSVYSPTIHLHFGG